MDNVLLCTERIDNRRAELDPVIFADPRVMANLLVSEKNTMINFNYFEKVQMDITSSMRHIVTNWMMEVCEEMSCENQVFPLSVRLMDQFLSVCKTSRQNLQLLGAVCLHVASKVRQVQPLAVQTLVYYTDNSITTEDMLRVELMLLLKLHWNVSFVTASDFVEHIMSRVTWAQESPHLRRHAHLLLQLCCSDEELIYARPSAVASGCLMAAARGLRIPSMSKVCDQVCSLTQVPEEAARDIERRVEALVKEEEARHTTVRTTPPTPSQQPLKPNSTGSVSGNGSAPLDIVIDEPMDTSQPETPTDVQDVHF